MRYAFAIASLGLACFSLVLNRTQPSVESWACRAGLCQVEQRTTASAASVSPFALAAQLNERASDPYLWSDYAEVLNAGGDAPKSSAAFEHATALGPNLPPVLIRAAYFAFSHDQFERGTALSNRVLAQTPAFDPLVFSYLQYYGQGRAAAIESGIPASTRPAQAWAIWIAANGSEAEVKDAFSWLQSKRLLDQSIALELAWKVWQRQFFGSAQGIWSAWLGSTNESKTISDEKTTELLRNGQFEREPDGSPFDWTIPKSTSAEISRDHGLAIRFLGTENVKLQGIGQSVTVEPGRYRFSAVVQSNGLTTDQRPFFRIFDPAKSNVFNLELPQVPETVAKSVVSYDFVVPHGTTAITIELERQSSDRFDNKIEGTLRVYDVSLVASARSPSP